MAIQSSAALQTLLNRIHRKSYPAYKETKGIYQFDRYVLSIDHVQGDPFASPSKVSIRVLGKDARFLLYCMTVTKKDRSSRLSDPQISPGD